MIPARMFILLSAFSLVYCVLGWQAALAILLAAAMLVPDTPAETRAVPAEFS